MENQQKSMKWFIMIGIFVGFLCLVLVYLLYVTEDDVQASPSPEPQQPNPNPNLNPNPTQQQQSFSTSTTTPSVTATTMSSSPSPSPKPIMLASPSDLLQTFKGSGQKFRMGVIKQQPQDDDNNTQKTIQCVRIDLGGDDKFGHQDDVHLVACDPNDDYQHWTYDDTTRRIQTYANDKDGNKLCFDYDNNRFKVTRCDDDPAVNREFHLDAADNTTATATYVDNDNPKNTLQLWDRSHNTLFVHSSNTHNTIIPLRIRPASDNNQHCIANPSRDERRELKTASCTSNSVDQNKNNRTNLYLMT